MNLQTKYISLDEFKEYTGIDLEAELATDSNPSNTANAFLKRIEVRMEAFINSNFARDIDLEYPMFTGYQKLHYKYALMEQALYVFRNSDISVDSGYDLERGIIAGKHDLKELIIAPNTVDQLRLCNLWNRNIKSNRMNAMWWMR